MVLRGRLRVRSWNYPSHSEVEQRLREHRERGWSTENKNIIILRFACVYTKINKSITYCFILKSKKYLSWQLSNLIGGINIWKTLIILLHLFKTYGLFDFSVVIFWSFKSCKCYVLQWVETKIWILMLLRI